jgi:hypothetical protein
VHVNPQAPPLQLATAFATVGVGQGVVAPRVKQPPLAGLQVPVEGGEPLTQTEPAWVQGPVQVVMFLHDPFVCTAMSSASQFDATFS